MDAELTRLAAEVAEIKTMLVQVIATVNGTHLLVNSRMTQLTETMEKLAEVQSQLAGEQGEARGRAQATDAHAE